MADKFHPGNKVRHKKSGGLYEVMATARLEATLEPVHVYRSLADGQVWVRPDTEMLDGRFELVNAPTGS